MPRKTLKTERLIVLGNKLLKKSTGSQDYRQGVIDLMKSVLDDSGSNMGFRYLYDDEVPPGCLPGIRCHPGGYILPPDAAFHETDPTRILYLITREIQISET